MQVVDKRKFKFVKSYGSISEIVDSPSYSYWKSVGKQFWRKKSTRLMLFVLVMILFMSFLYPLFSDFDFNDVSKVNDFSVRYVAPNSEYWFGTDGNGQSLFDSVWYGARNSILIAVIATVVTVLIGILVGSIWGVSKSVDRVMVEVYNVVVNIPYLLVIIIINYSVGTGFWNLIFAISIISWLEMAYFIRVQILRLRDLEYNLVSQTLGTPLFKIIIKNLLPQLVSVIVTSTSQMLPNFISAEAFLSFFGLGLPVTEPSLGRLIAIYAHNVTNNAYLFWIPLTILVLASLSFYIVGQNLSDASDPRTHQ